MNIPQGEIQRYILNGIVATIVHFIALTINIELLHFSSAGLANFVAALFGITVSFLGSRYFVFRGTQGNLFPQMFKFSGLYGFIAVLHGITLWFWTDWLVFDYQSGFLAATALQVSLSYIGNKFLVFRR